VSGRGSRQPLAGENLSRTGGGIGWDVDASNLIQLSIEAKLRRSGGVVHQVVRPNISNSSPNHPNLALIKAVARGRGWYEEVIEAAKLGEGPVVLQFSTCTTTRFSEGQVVTKWFRWCPRVL